MIVVILIGFPGSGKSFYANKISGYKLIVSSDHYFTDANGNYNWTIEESHKGHEYCLREFIKEFIPGPPSGDPPRSPDVVIVDNTNLKIQDISPYIRIAQAYGCEIEVKYMDTDIDLAKSRNIHGVPASVYDHMKNNLEFLIENWPKDFPPIEFINQSIDDGYPNYIDDKIIPIYGATFSGAPAYGCLFPEPKVEFNVILTDPGPNKIKIIKWFRDNTDLSLQECKSLVDNCPKKIFSDICESQYKNIKKELKSLGAKIEIR